MKSVQCELCGGTDIVKEEDFFVCQSCGMKYTPESVKKMMVEGVVQVEGTVKIDDSGQIEKYLVLAENAHKSDNEKEAEEYAKKALEIDPKHVKALYIKGLAIGWQTNGVNNRIPEAIDSFSLAIENCTDEVELEELKKKVVADVSKLTLAIIRMRCNNFKKFPSKENANKISLEAANNMYLSIKLVASCGVVPEKFTAQAATMMDNAAVAAFNSSWDDYTDKKPLLPMKLGFLGNYKTGEPEDRSRYAIPSEHDWRRFTERGDACRVVLKAAIELDNDDDEQDLIRYDNLIDMSEKIRDSCSIYSDGGNWKKEWCFNNSAKEARTEEIETWKKEKERIQINKYWACHEDEKTQIEQKIKELTEETNSFVTDDEYVRTKQKIEKLTEQIKEKNHDLRQLGVFKGSKKKELKRQVYDLIAEKQQLVDEVKPKEDAIAEKQNELEHLKAKLENPLE